MNASTQDATGGKKSWWQRLAGGLKRTSSQLGSAISDLVMRGPLSPERIVEIEEALIRADLGVDVASRIATKMGDGRYHDLQEVKNVLAAEMEQVLAPVAKPLAVSGAKPFTSWWSASTAGKTTTTASSRPGTVP
jgi:fused signal recognition particle receptor